MRRASFKATPEAMRVGARAAAMSADGRSSAGKDVTRRKGWHWAERGMFLLAVEKCQGLKPGEIVETFGIVEIVSVRREPLDRITELEVVREGFADMTPAGFVDMFIANDHVGPSDSIARVEFVHIDPRRCSLARNLLLPHQRKALGIVTK